MASFNESKICITKIYDIVPVNSFKQYIATDVTDKPCYGLSYKVSGNVNFHSNGKIMEFSPGMVCYFPKGVSYQIERLESGEAIQIDFDVAQDPGLELFTSKFKSHEAIGMSFQKLVDMSRISIQEFDYHIVAMVYELLNLLDESARMSYIGVKCREQISSAANYLGEHYADADLNLAELAVRNGMSVSTFRRNFSRVYGMPPIKYLSILRLNAAKSMLTATDMSMEQVAALTGFNDQFYFSKCFKEKCGISPSEYRKKNQ